MTANVTNGYKKIMLLSLCRWLQSIAVLSNNLSKMLVNKNLLRPGGVEPPTF